MMEADHEDGSYHRNKELKLLDETKAGVKGLVDAGLTKLPKIFVHDGHKVNISSSSSATNCPEPELIGELSAHTHNQWIDVTHISGAFIINLSDMMQLITNDKFMSAKHGVFAQKAGPRVLVSCSLRQYVQDECPRMYGLIKELVTEESLQIYKEIKMPDLIKLAYTTKLDDDVSPLKHFGI
ncbi:hypothetical protein Ahy_B05g073976 [Arachis hypogaea]|uniref:Isopenicillin N synthase-like Fe(2+) 2OG dioxygenase domain-containing protein n=1 Tax=Arachis hypogaea TaxID=3818 RepID=A0A444YXL6_ARAHY|nr:hypothetical protein Ahy_B05g073976 [Arachis hypogaea]